jgi:hypothetical protein
MRQRPLWRPGSSTDLVLDAGEADDRALEGSRDRVHGLDADVFVLVRLIV